MVAGPRSRLLRCVAPQLPRLMVAGFAAVGTELAGVALIGTATWLIVRAAEQPPIAALAVAIVAVRALATARGTLRYAKRLAGHTAALRVLAELRTRVYAALTPRLPSGGGPDAARGDLLSRLVSDVDGVQDLLVRCLMPGVVAVVVCGATVAFTAVVLPAAALVLAAGLLVAGAALPSVTAALTRRAAAQLAGTRGALAAHAVDLLDGVPDLAAYGATGAALAERAATHHAVGRACPVRAAGRRLAAGRPRRRDRRPECGAGHAPDTESGTVRRGGRTRRRPGRAARPASRPCGTTRVLPAAVARPTGGRPGVPADHHRSQGHVRVNPHLVDDGGAGSL